MTESLQQKIDDIINQDECPGCYEYRCLITIGPDLDKALQEFREQINNYKSKNLDNTWNLDWIPKSKVLSLIGEKQ